VSVMTVADAAQAAILIGGGLAIWAIGRPVGHPLRRPGFLVGLLCQPVWIWESLRAGREAAMVLDTLRGGSGADILHLVRTGQPGILVLSAWFAWSYWAGWRNNAPQRAEEHGNARRAEGV